MNDRLEKEKFVLIDGNSLMNRAFYALPLLTTKQGFFTNAVYGFVSMLVKTIEDEKPNYLAVVFDKALPTFRHERYPEYKGHREKTPEELRGQISLLKELLEAMDIFFYEREGYEADDLIGAITKEVEEEEDKEVLIISGDKDLFQLLSNSTKLLLTRKGITEFELYDKNKISEMYDLDVEQFVDLKALMGDKSDNIPGVPGIGEKTALKLLKEFNSLEEVMEKIDEISAKKAANRLKEHSDKAYLSKELAKIYRDVPLELNWEKLKNFNISSDEALELLSEWEMKSIIKRLSNEESESDLSKENRQAENVFNVDYNYIETDNWDYKKDELIECLKHSGEIALYYYDHDEAPVQKTIDSGEFGLGVVFSPSKCYFVTEEIVSDFIIEVLHPYFPNKIVTHRVKKLWHLFYDETGVDLSNINDLNINNLKITDTEICGYILDPTGAPHTPKDLSFQYLGYELKNNNEGYQGVIEWAYSLLELENHLREKLKEEDQLDLYEGIELPLTFVLAKMEHRGITVNKDELDRMENEIDVKVENFKNRIFELAGEEFNLNSPKQLGRILFEKLNLPVIKKTKTGYSTSAQVLETLANEHEICRLILDYRQLYKLKTTYLVGLKDLISKETGKIHTTFNQTITVTGRLSSTEPNLQNIPIRLDEGRKIRKAFVTSSKSYNFLACDYSQIELRILAHVSQDEKLIDAFLKGEDFHTQTASLIFNVPASNVDSTMRSHAKAVNFGIVYGISDYGLSTQLNITRKQAKSYIDNYFSRFSGVKEYTDSVIKKAREDGYVKTLYHRKRKLPDILHNNFNIRTAAERTAINTPIQGTAADIIKKAMVEVEEKLKDEGYLDQAKLLLQVHDELVLEVNNEIFDEIALLVKDIMEGVIELKVPLDVDLKRGTNWYDMYDYEIKK
ncbi:DNA polymerase I [Natranaerofaba carboxydovora]|uniref:DNA polymerase I n=1 Tax=Natranaerofaba carboxydovora TaxID=2742683 RepID=UPI001F144324|nr:DNA polymerase I [Natranaerofaba carboxydovora]UMZ72561.1 DNA polymerase I [Natranaerofaba carboxydovora]